MNNKWLVAPGGGACGRFQVGVMANLYDRGYLQKIDEFAGTSVGGLNILCASKNILNFNNIVDMWKNIKCNKDIFEGMLQFKSIWDIFGTIGQLFFTNKGKSLLNPKGLYKIIDNEFGNLTLGDLMIPVTVSVTDMTNGDRITFSSKKNPTMKIAPIAKATSAIPFAFPGIEIQLESGEVILCSDGGILRNCPVQYAAESGATHILLIGTFPDVYPKYEGKNEALPLCGRIPEIIMHENEEESWEAVKHYPNIKVLDIYPIKSTGSALKFDNIEQYEIGYNYCKDNITDEMLDEFFK